MKLAFQKSEELSLKQSVISKEQLRDTTSSGTIYVVCAGLLVVTGVPAFLVSHLWTILDLSTLLKLSVSGGDVLRMVYIAGLGCCLPLLVMLGAFKLLSSNLDRLAATLEITDRGLCWRANNLLTVLSLRLTRQPLSPVAWDRIRVITTGESSSQLNKDYKELEGLVVEPKYHTLGYTGNINFIGVEKEQFRSLASVSVQTLSKEAKQNLASLINSYASAAVMTKTAIEELVGTSVAVTKDLSYTDIWLNVLHSKDDVEKRISDLVTGDCLNDNKLKIIRKLATGGQANLFLAEDEHGENVVVKEYIVSTVDTASAMIGLEEFESESSILEKISHVNCVKMHGVFAEQGRAYIILEYYKGRSLREIVDADGALESDRVVPIAEQLADVLGYLHALKPPVLHRDISPDNVIVMDDGCVKLIDFSVARQGESKDAADFVGKASYVSPDQFRGFVSRKNDVYGYGATLYFALTGKDPEPISQLVVPVAVTCESDDSEDWERESSVSFLEELNSDHGDSAVAVVESQMVCKLLSDLSSVIFKCTSIEESSPSYESMMEVVRDFRTEKEEAKVYTNG